MFGDKYDQTNAIQSEQVINNQRQQRQTQEIDRLQREVEETRGVLVSNFEALIERGDNVDGLLQRAEQLENAAMCFVRNARHVRRRFCCQAYKVTK